MLSNLHMVTYAQRGVLRKVSTCIAKRDVKKDSGSCGVEDENLST